MTVDLTNAIFGYAVTAAYTTMTARLVKYIFKPENKFRFLITDDVAGVAGAEVNHAITELRHADEISATCRLRSVNANDSPQAQLSHTGLYACPRYILLSKQPDEDADIPRLTPRPFGCRPHGYMFRT